MVLEKAVIHLLIYYCSVFNVDPILAISVMEHESHFNVNAIGEKGEVGLFQLNPVYYKGYDIHNTSMNIKLGVKYLAETQTHCKNKADKTFIICYNQGIYRGSQIRYPKKNKYYIETMKIYNNYLKEYGLE
jgi:soluble lytic murein transglycosylase-like protein